MELKCLKCRSEGAYKYGHMKGYQRYRCKNCGYQFTKMTPRGKPERDKILALILYLSGLSSSATVRILGVTAQSVMRWIRKMYDRFITEKPDISEVKEVEMDEIRHYYKKTQKLWIWKTIDHRSKNLIRWAFGHRDTKTLVKMYDRMQFEEIPHVCADHYGSYKEFFPAKKTNSIKALYFFNRTQ